MQLKHRASNGRIDMAMHVGQRSSQNVHIQELMQHTIAVIWCSTLPSPNASADFHLSLLILMI